ncbi:MAG: L-serine ammonia-lyase [Desulfovibrionaceae bacterium]|nr:L-serine ammonia-lyase [Desulfovibrionaceae bacterium]
MSITRRAFLSLSCAGMLSTLSPLKTWAGFDPLWRSGLPVGRPIDTSVLEIFKIGPGPSSSHTIAPMKAGNDFLALAKALPQEQLASADMLRVRLFNSMSSTGIGHHTDKAILAGLLGEEPETCSGELLDGLFAQPNDTRTVAIGSVRLPFSRQNIVFEKEHRKAPVSDVFTISLHAGEKTLLEREYYSVGGGFLQWKGWTPPERGKPRHSFDSMNGLLQLCQSGLSIPQIMLENEMAITGLSKATILKRLEDIVLAMDSSVTAGLSIEGKLEGPYKLERRAASMYKEALALPAEERFLASLSAFAHAAAEENSQGHRIVTAPTAGSAGVMPALVHMLLSERKKAMPALIDGLLTASVVGMLIKRHASVAGADVGCQGEIGSASAMSAALLAQVQGEAPEIIENAAEHALEHHLGMTCDPVDGYVQIPCIARCAMGAVKAWNAFLMAKTGRGTFHPVGLDVTIRTMAATGQDMDARYRETAQGGLALFYVQGC